ncbi:hypothetical protein DdX_04804 [Ditylenchus destructor]|uniref:Uncharacterized protein n=1 Tax=Ditylenchus destructor TaxID=166010 RepID=A0AAD4RAB6_9BILA|nr:hypothetical protein DdX_04804 [Ditylenchus destructor]
MAYPYSPYKPISWEKYYSTTSSRTEHVTVTSGLAAGITIGVFFVVFLLTFGCRLYNRRLDRRSSVRTMRRRLSVTDLFLRGSSPSQPPPPYEVAIKMPRPTETGPPAFTEYADTPPPMISSAINPSSGVNDIPVPRYALPPPPFSATAK